jgi:carboxymethylenebutenolidase
MALREYLIGEVVEDYADGQMTRREAMRRLGLLALSTGAATALLAACGTSGESASAPTSAGGTGATTAGAKAEIVTFTGPSGKVKAAWAPASKPKASVLVIHENKGLTPHFHDLVGRFAKEGYSALCVDLLSEEGGTASFTDPAAAPTALSKAPMNRLIGDLRAGVDELKHRLPDVKTGAVGFCFGGGLTWQLLNAGEARLAAAVPFYGPAPANPDFSKAKAAVLAIYGGLDTRVLDTKPTVEAALRKVQPPLIFDFQIFQGAKHAFFNDTGANYNAQAAARAWTLMLAWFQKHLA